MHKNDQILLRSGGRVRPIPKDTGGGCDQAVPSTSSCVRGSESEKSGWLVCRDMEDRCVESKREGRRRGDVEWVWMCLFYIAGAGSECKREDVMCALNKSIW
jgi:hypothetical protein